MIRNHPGIRIFVAGKTKCGKSALAAGLAEALKLPHLDFINVLAAIAQDPEVPKTEEWMRSLSSLVEPKHVTVRSHSIPVKIEKSLRFVTMIIFNVWQIRFVNA
jgi:adenylate kinase family enzyme